VVVISIIVAEALPSSWAPATQLLQAQQSVTARPSQAKECAAFKATGSVWDAHSVTSGAAGGNNHPMSSQAFSRSLGSCPIESALSDNHRFWPWGHGNRPMEWFIEPIFWQNQDPHLMRRKRIVKYSNTCATNDSHPCRFDT